MAWSSFPGAFVRKHFSISVYMRTALAVLTTHLLGTAIRARHHFPAISGLGSFACPWSSRTIHLGGILKRFPLQPQYGLGLEPTAHWVVDAQSHPL